MKFTIKQFFKRFPDDDACLDAIMASRRGGSDRMPCPNEKCGRDALWYRVEGRRAYACQFCGHHYYPCVGTPFEGSRTSLVTWFYAIYLFTTTRHGVPAKELERQLGVGYKTAWRMGHEIRKLMASEDPGTLEGHVEIDEAYFGGKRSGGKRGRGAPNKTILVGMIERGGKSKLIKASNVRKSTLRAIVRGNIAEGSTVSTDELASYNLLKGDGYRHGVVRHAMGMYASEYGFHVNSIEGFWARLKLSIRGTHVHVSGKYLQHYAAEFSYRYNHRKEGGAAMFDRLFEAL